MNRPWLLKLLVVTNIFVAFASAGAEGFFGWTLPPVLAAYRHERFGQLPLANAGDVLHLMLLALLTLTAFVAWTGLLVSWRRARRLYLLCMVMSVVFELTSGPVVMTSVGAAFRMMDGLVSGAILGLIYFSDLARTFEPARAERSTTTEMQLGPGRA